MSDTYYAEYTKELVPSFLLIKVSLAQTILGVIAGSLLTMTTITFSMIMVVLTTYSSQFSPRTLPNFITNRNTMRVLGIFMGGFVYSIFALLFMRQVYSHAVISASVGVLVAFVCLSFFAYFIHHVATSIQVSNLTEEIVEDALNAVHECEKTASADLAMEKPNLGVNGLPMTRVKSDSIGYIQYIDYPKLCAAAEQKQLIIEMEQTIGAFVTPNKTLMKVFHHDKELNLDTGSYIQVGRERTTLQDVEFSMQKIVEITLRAISPGINDPNTAIAGILQLGMLLSQICKKDGSYLIFRDKKDFVRVVGRQHNVEELLYSTFYQICHYGRQDISIFIAVLDALILIAEDNLDHVKHKVSVFSQYVEKAFDQSTFQALDFQLIAEKKRHLVAVVAQNGFLPKP